MARIIYIKDKDDFLKEYFKEDSSIRERVEWRDSIILNKVDIRILIPSVEKETREALKQIKD